MGWSTSRLCITSRLARRGTIILLFGILLLNTTVEASDEAEATALFLRTQELYRAKKYKEAFPMAERVLQMSKLIYGIEDANTAASLDLLASLHLSTGNYAPAEKLYQQALTIYERRLPPGDPFTITVLNHLALLYVTMAQHAKAEPIYQRILALQEQTLGPAHKDTLESMDRLGLLYDTMRKYSKGELLYRRALTIEEKNLGPNDLAVARTLNNLATLYEHRGDYLKAEPLYLRSLAIKEKSLDPNALEIATALNNLAVLYRAMGDYPKAKPLQQRALTITEEVCASNDPRRVIALRNLASIYLDMSDYMKAEPLFQRAFQEAERIFNPEHHMVAAALDSIANLYGKTNEYLKAEALYLRSLAIKEKSLGPNTLETAITLDMLGGLYRSMNDYAKAEPLHRRAVTIVEEVCAPVDPQRVTMLGNLALVYLEMGDYVNAEPLFERALQEAEKMFAPEHHVIADVLANLASLYDEQQNFSKAMPLALRGLAIRERSFGPKHAVTGHSLNQVALIYAKTGHYSDAEPLYRRAVAIFEEADGRKTEASLAMNNLAGVYKKMGDYANAESLFKRALATAETALGPANRTTTLLLSNLATMEIDLGKISEALELARRAAEGQERQLANILSFTSEQQRLAFQLTTQPYCLPATLGSASDLARSVLRNKGVVLDSLLEDRLVAEVDKDAARRGLIDALRAAKQRYTQLFMEVPRDSSARARQARDNELRERSKQVEQIEAALAREVSGLGRARRALSITVAQVQGALAPDQALIELVRYTHYAGKNKLEQRYGAVVITSTGGAKWVPLGAAEEMEEMIALYGKSARAKTDEPTLDSVLRVLYEKLWAPIENALDLSIKTVIVSPDGDTNFVSFATLLTPSDKFLCEKYAVRYVGSGRDLLREREPSKTRLMAIFGSPDYRGEVSTMARRTETMSPFATRTLEMRDFGKIPLQPLPGTKKECIELASQSESNGLPIKTFLDTEATELHLRQIEFPHILHLATHGFFLSNSDDQDAGDRLEDGAIGLGLGNNVYPKRKGGVSLQNPMHRSGLALTGAQRTLDAWAKGKVPPPDNDGVLTAEEVGSLKLKDTWLAVLSACDTGTGEARAGEGVMGLRRGFSQAGVQNLLITLWSINDQTTARIMLDFYQRAFSTGNAPSALTEVQRDCLVQLRNERGLLAAVQLAGPFIMSSQGPP